MIKPKGFTMINITQRHVFIGVVAFVLIMVFVWYDYLMPGGMVEQVKAHVPSWASIHSPSEEKDVPRLQFNNGTMKQYYTSTATEAELLQQAKFEKPPGVEKIMGLLFYGRRATVSIFDCYLKVRRDWNGKSWTAERTDLDLAAKPGEKWWHVGRSHYCRANYKET